MIQIALTGKPNSGKSSTLKALTLVDVKVSPVPFTTIKSNTAIAHVMVDCVCKEFGLDCSPRVGYCKNGKRAIPVKIIDVGGLIPGSHLGKGIGNAFLDDIRQASCLIQVVDASGLTDSEGKPTEGYEPGEEIRFLEQEIDLWFASIIERAMKKFERLMKSKPKIKIEDVLAEQLTGLEIKKWHIQRALEKVPLSEIEQFARELRRLSKPILIAANKIDLKPAQENFERLKERYEGIVPMSAEAEIALKRAAESGLIEYLPGNDFKILDRAKLGEKQLRALEFIKREVIDRYGSTGVQDCLNRAVFELLNCIVVYPVEDESKLTDSRGAVLPDAHLMPSGSSALDLAFKIHTEIAERFICAIDARTKKRLGKDYQLKNNDVIRIMFSR